jgi:putative iron-regulated protein
MKPVPFAPIVFFIVLLVPSGPLDSADRPIVPRPKLAIPGPSASPGGAIDSTPIPAEEVAKFYVVLAHARYSESLEAAKQLFDALNRFVREPSAVTHEEAKAAWIAAHRVYSTAEVFRFGNPNVDAWETRVNAWPIDEGFLDYVSPGYAYEGGNPHALYNLIASDFQIAASFITEARSETDPKAGVYRGFTDNETNVATGYHAIEFLLWGQDLNDDPRASGQRPYTDYVVGTGANAGRRGEYLVAVGGILVADLLEAVQDWDPANPVLYSKLFRDLPVEDRLDRIILGMGGLSNAELAGERILVSLLASDQEEEQSCFSDTTHLGIHENALSIETIYLGRHERRDGAVVSGPSLSDLVAKIDPALDARLKSQFARTREAVGKVVNRAETVEPFDRMILAENSDGRAVLNDLIAALKAQTESLEEIRLRVAELVALR